MEIQRGPAGPNTGQRCRHSCAILYQLHDTQMLAVSDLLIKQLKARAPADPADWAFTCFSQWGEDGLIQYLLHHLPGLPATFVEIGVEDYRQSNTRFLLIHDNWRGRLVDCEARHIEFLETSGLRWQYDIEPVQAFVTRENVNEILAASGFREGLGLLSIDIDGVDYWIWEAIRDHRPAIVVIEYSSLFGCRHAITVPYDPAFDRRRAHSSTLYYGASLPALARLAAEKGYVLVCGNQAGNNAFFVRKDLAAPFAAKTPAQVYRPAHFRESRDDAGRLLYLGEMKDRLALIKDLPVVNLETGGEMPLGALDWEGSWTPPRVP